MYSKQFLISSLFFILVTGCSPQISLFYNSSAFKPNMSTKTLTHFKLLNQKDDSIIPIAIIEAEDSKLGSATLKYLLIAPYINPLEVGSLKIGDVNVTMGVPLDKNQTDNLISVLESASDDWNKNYEDNEGISYEFNVTTEEMVYQVSENIIKYVPKVELVYQNNNRKPMVSILFGEEGSYRYLTISDKNKLNSFLTILKRNSLPDKKD